MYTYSPSAFQSLPLKAGAAWSELSMGVAVTGGTCVQATPPDASTPAALYIVGGRTNSTDGYSGLQRYTFADGKWETIQPSTAVTQNRIYHNSVYLNESASILVYAGNQDENMIPSSQTFTISTLPPYNVLAYESIAPPAVAPLLMPWSESKAVMIGGSDTNTKVMIFSPAKGWEDSGSSLAEPLAKNITAIKAVVQNGNDGSKNLYTFDMSVSPNTVNRTILVDADGNPVTGATPILSRSLDDRNLYESSFESNAQLEKRGNLTLNNWPPYNSSLVSTHVRSEYAMAKDQSGLVVIAGGSDEDVLCMFAARDNCWLNATQKLTARTQQDVVGLGGSTTSTSTGSATTTTATQTPTSTGATDSSAKGRAETVKILAAVLGSVIGVALLLLIILLLLRWRRNRRRFIDAGHQRRASGLEEKNPMDFQDRGISYSDSIPAFQSHRQHESQGSFSSMAILMGKVGNGHKRGMMGRGNGSNASDSSSTFNKKYKTAISNPIPQSAPAPFIGMPRDEKGVSFAPAAATAAAAAPTPRPRASGTARRGSTRRSSGWNRYWSGGSAMNILGFGSRRTTGYSDHTDRTSTSQYSDSGVRPHISQPSAVVPPLNLGGPPRLSRVASNSPTIAAHNHSSFPLKEGMAGKIERPSSAISDASSYDDHRDAFSSGVPESVRDESSWTPFGASGWASGAPSVAYTESNYDSSTHPRNTTNDYNSRHDPMPNFPAVPDGRKQGQPTTDMSWLNLGAGDRR